MKSLYWFGAVWLACAAGVGARATPPPSADPAVAELESDLSRMPRPWERRIHRLTLPEYESTLAYWAAKYPTLCTLEKRGRSTGGLPVYLMKVTDPSVPNADKQVCLVTALHGGPERSGSTTSMRLLEWLLGDSAAAREIRRRQIVLVMPIMNPYGFFVTDRFGNEQKIDTYNAGPQWWDLEKLRLKDPTKTPEIAAMLSVVDEYQPDIHADLHGTGLQAVPDAQLGDRTMYEGQTMFVEAAGAISNNALRSWDWRINDRIDQSARDAGFGLDRNEADAQRLFWGQAFAALTDRVWTARPLFYTAHYGYVKYHTMITTFEIGWEDSGLARMRGLLDIGNHTWLDEDVVGYPVNKLRSYLGCFITAYGQTAAERRSSRVELWSNQGGFAVGCLYPQTDGHGLVVCGITPAAVKAMDSDLGKFEQNLQQFPEVRADLVKRFISAGPENILISQAPTAGHPAVASVEHGIGLRVRIPYRHPELLEVRLNGDKLKEDLADGYHTWFADGWTNLQVNIPPVRARSLGIAIVSYAYKPDTVRNYGFVPPAEVTAQLRNGGK